MFSNHIKKMTLTTPNTLTFSSICAPSPKLTININAFNGNKTNFGKR